MTVEEAIRFLSKALVAHLGLVSEGKPYVTPMCFVVDDDSDSVTTQPEPSQMWVLNFAD